MKSNDFKENISTLFFWIVVWAIIIGLIIFWVNKNVDVPEDAVNSEPNYGYGLEGGS